MNSPKQPAEEVNVFVDSYWDRPPPNDQGDKEPSQIYQAVGYALSQWEMADQAIATLFLMLTECSTASTYNAIRPAYGSIVSNAGRRDAVKAAAEVYFGHHWQNKAVRRSLTNITEAVNRASRRRDDIAHGIVCGNITVDGKAYGAFHMPPEYNTDRTHAFMPLNDSLGFTRAKYRFVAADILSFGYKFGMLRNAIWNYTDSIRKINGVIPLAESLVAPD